MCDRKESLIQLNAALKITMDEYHCMEKIESRYNEGTNAYGRYSYTHRVDFLESKITLIIDRIKELTHEL